MRSSKKLAIGLITQTYCFKHLQEVHTLIQYKRVHTLPQVQTIMHTELYIAIALQIAIASTHM